ncbi:MAG: FecR family protein [Prolixibacteraceae bacterium]|jgi:ferric-dicitrate binding protein FerR (iron transport regulator)|nr:FecR family protein [Prolixibacteraceae bacterium]
MENQNTWERIAAKLHGEVQGPSGQQGPGQDIRIEKMIGQVHASRNDVKKIQEFQSPEMVWEKLKRQLSRKNWFREWPKYAAVAVVAILITIVADYFADNYISGKQYASVSSPIGQITNLTLFDGTNVWLNAGSTLKYKKTFNWSDREVYLDGEALFEVEKNNGRSFVVHAGNSSVKVHGTVFDVRAYSNMSAIETVLIEGSVEFISNGNSVFISPGERLICSMPTGKITKSGINTAEYTSWKGGKISFNNKSLDELIVQLEHWYEVKFRFESEELKDYRFTGVINKDRSLDYTLNIIQEINKVKFKINQEEIIIMASK